VSPLALTLIVSASLCWAGLDAARKALAERIAPVALAGALTLAQVPFFLLWWWLSSRGELSFPRAYLPIASASISLNIAALLLFIRSLAIAPLSLTIPLLSLTPVLTAAAGFPLLGEAPTYQQLGGVLLVVIGALQLGPTRRAADDTEQAAERAAARAKTLRGRLMMAGVAALWAITGPVDKLALRHVSHQLHGLWVTLGIGIVLIAFLAARRRLGELAPIAQQKAIFALAALLGAVALGLQLWSFQFALVSIVETIKRAIGMVAALINGLVFFSEPITLGKVLTVAMMSLGVALLLL
jgi:drug/metabolite transporter (DMT)-like permease